MLHSQWAAPIVPVPKKDGSVRICGDFKVTVNQASLTEQYPLPRAEDLFADLSGGKYFTKLDLSNAYLQLPLSNAAKKYVTINTHKGLFQYNRLPFGIASAPAIFQRTMETLLRGQAGVSVYVDDVLVTGATVEEHLRNLDAVLGILENAGLRLNKSKCFFLRSRIEYLGHIIDGDGLHPTDEKVTALKEALPPTNLTELRSFLGIVNYYAKFLPNNAYSFVSPATQEHEMGLDRPAGACLPTGQGGTADRFCPGALRQYQTPPARLRRIRVWRSVITHS